MNKPSPVIILGIESSCDETSAAISSDNNILANIIATQDIHKSYGGVVPELASRAHQANIVPVVSEALKYSEMKLNNIHAIAYTRGPGLLGSLLVGSSFAKALALALNLPLIEVNHMQAHILCHFIEDAPMESIDKKARHPEFPFICLTVSGGHTQLVLVKSFNTMEVIGETIDDAAGEAFDKAAKILGLPYPGGPLIDKYAREGNIKAYAFPSPKVAGLNFSFSGLKTSFMNFITENSKKDIDFTQNNIHDICASIQSKIIDLLLEKASEAMLKYNIKQIAIAGGVSANSEFRKRLLELAHKNGWEAFIPKMKYCTDNAAMIAITGYYKYLNKEFSSQNEAASARYNL